MANMPANDTTAAQDTTSNTSASTSSNTAMGRSTSSRTLLDIKKDGTREAVVEHVLEVNKMIAPRKKPEMFKMERSSLFTQLESFLPTLEESNKQLDALPESERHNLCMEVPDEDPGSKYIELSILESEEMQKSKVFQLLDRAGASSAGAMEESCSGTSDSDSDSTDSDDSDSDKSDGNNTPAKKLSLVRSMSDKEEDNSADSSEMSCDR